MAEPIFNQSPRRKITPEELGGQGNPLDEVKNVQQAVARETGREVPNQNIMEEAPFQMTGNIPPQLRDTLMKKATIMNDAKNDDADFETFEAPPDKPRPQVPRKEKLTPDRIVNQRGSDQLDTLLQKLAQQHTWESFEFPSKGKFYTDIPSEINIRAMTGGEEQILATPRWVKRGKAIDMIFDRCIKEKFNTEKLLSVDRTNLLIYLRGISYTPEYDVEIKCPTCSVTFPHLIDLNDLGITQCPDDFGPDDLQGVLPVSGFSYSYRLATGLDEQEISMYQEKRVKDWGDQGEDDTLLYRTALLLQEIEGVSMKKELALLLKKLPIQDVAHLRNEINTPPFGVDTSLTILCPACYDEFKIDLPLETGFFFPRKKEEKTQA